MTEQELNQRHEQHDREMGFAKEWRCFHCDDVFTDSEEARVHFGDYLNSEPACKIGAGFMRKYREMEAEVSRLRTDIDAEVSSNEIFNARLEMLLNSYRPFRQCRSVRDVFNVFDSMEGRAIAAESKSNSVREHSE